MTREECVTLTQYIGEICPQQRIGNATGLAWFDVLGHLEFTECRQAAAAIAGRQPFVAPSEIIAEIADARSARRPHSNACRDGDHGDCRVSWCGCTCHPRAVKAVAAPPPSSGPAISRPGDPRQITAGDLPARRRP